MLVRLISVTFIFLMTCIISSAAAFRALVSSLSCSFRTGGSSFHLVGAMTSTWKHSHHYGSIRRTMTCAPNQQHKRQFLRSIGHRTIPTMMPEGPEVKTLVNQLQPIVGMRLINMQFLSGRYVRHGRPTGFDDFRKTMTIYNHHDEKKTTKTREEQDQSDNVDIIKEWNAKGKLIYIILDDGNRGKKNILENDAEEEGDFQRSIWITLGMSGRFVSEMYEKEDNAKGAILTEAQRPRWYIEVLDLHGVNITQTNQRRHKIYYHDPRNFGTLKFSLSKKELRKKLNSLGPDILADEESMSEEVFLNIMERQKPQLNVCKFLMDQSKLAGIGNYLLAEGLYRANIDPFASLSELDNEQKRTLYQEIREAALESYDSQGMTRRGGSYRDVQGHKGQFVFQLQCYGREISAHGKPVIKEADGPHGRTIWYVEDQLFVPRSMRASDGKKRFHEDESVQMSESAPIATRSNTGAGSGADGKMMNPSTDLAASLTDESWREALGDFVSSETFKSLEDFIDKERASGATIYPPKEEIFAALNLCPLDNVRVVIVGQDPYHGPGQGHGLAFSVRKGVQLPPSLQNIFKEAMNDEGISMPTHGNLESWARQGVLLLNAVLTVRRGEANSHAKKGWEEFTDRVIEIINDRKEGLVFLLWGVPAAKKADGVDKTKHVIIKTSHPSPLGATKTNSPFLGSKCFSRANEALVKEGKEPIDWNVY